MSGDGAEGQGPGASLDVLRWSSGALHLQIFSNQQTQKHALYLQWMSFLRIEEADKPNAKLRAN